MRLKSNSVWVPSFDLPGMGGSNKSTPGLNFKVLEAHKPLDHYKVAVYKPFKL